MEQIAFWGIPLIYWLLVAAFVLPKIPYVGKFFNVINTGIHELGHALMALVLQGQVLKIELFGDTSGAAVTKSANRFSAMLVSMSGYLFASAVAYLSFYLIFNSSCNRPKRVHIFHFCSCSEWCPLFMN